MLVATPKQGRAAPRSRSRNSPPARLASPSDRTSSSRPARTPCFCSGAGTGRPGRRRPVRGPAFISREVSRPNPAGPWFSPVARRPSPCGGRLGREPSNPRKRGRRPRSPLSTSPERKRVSPSSGLCCASSCTLLLLVRRQQPTAMGIGRVTVLARMHPSSGAGRAVGAAASRPHTAMTIFPRACPSP